MNFEQQTCQDDSLTCRLIALNSAGNFSSTAESLEFKKVQEFGQTTNTDFLSAKPLSLHELTRAEDELNYARKRNISILHCLSPNYPELLSQIPDPPFCLFFRGCLPTKAGVAIVGTRKCTRYGSRWAYELAKRITERGGVVVSGLAFGIDAAAHRGALDGARAARKHGNEAHPGIAVLGGGIDGPSVNRDLAEELLVEGGAVISEYGTRIAPRPYFFPRRNRIISGLSIATIVIEAAKRSGSLITGRLAAEQGRDVYALPGQIDCPTSSGVHALIREGARIIDSPEDCLGELGFALPVTQTSQAVARRTIPKLTTLGLGHVELQLCNVLLNLVQEQTECDLDTLISATAVSPSKLAGLLSLLELHGILEILPGNRYILGELIDSA